MRHTFHEHRGDAASSQRDRQAGTHHAATDDGNVNLCERHL
jgi:hypothetical protein